MEFADELVSVFKRLAEGDLTARLPRNFKRDNEDAIAFFMGVVAEQLAERQRMYREGNAAFASLIEKFIAVAGGDFAVRAERTDRGDAVDTLAFLLNNMAAELGDLVGEHDRQRMLLETVIESMIDGVMLLDPSGHIRHSNVAIANLLGRKPEELVSMHVSKILGINEAPLATQLSEELPLGPFRNRDTVFRTIDDRPLTMAVNGSTHRDVEGAVVGIVLVARDDRELKKVQAHLQLSERLATMGTLAAGVAHEINNPLAFITANVDFVLEELTRGAAVTPEQYAEIIRALRSSRIGAERVRNIVRDLGYFARSDPESVARVDLNALLDSAVGLIGNEIRHHARLVKRYGAPPPVIANEGRLVQVFLNLLHNAGQSIPVGAAGQNEIRITTGSDEGAAFVEVRDTGCGIAPEDLTRIFDLFFTTKPQGMGSGLGLSISRRLIERAGGRLDAQSDLGAGSAFRIVLPAAPSEAEERAPARRSSRAPKRRNSRRMRVLVIDDDLEVGRSVQRILGREHDVEVVPCAPDALAILDESYDVVLCDLLMPDMTGMDLFARLAETKPKLAERVVFMTGGAFSALAQEFLRQAANPSFEKPFDADALRAIVAQVGARARG